jgi:two-component system sensor histidine kinase KdpD
VRTQRHLATELGRAGASAAGVAVVTLAGQSLSVNTTTVSLLYLLLVLITATSWGLFQAIFVSLSATVCINFFFLPPVGTLTVADPQNWIALLAFLATAVIAGELSNRAQRQAAVAVEQRQELERLYALSRAVLLDTGEGALGRMIAHQIADTFGFPGVLLYDLRVREGYSAGSEDVSVSREVLESVQETVQLANGSHATPVRLGNKAVGVLALLGNVNPAALEAIANLVAITLEKAACQ